MANVKISQLTANAAKIASTDRIAIAKDTGGGTFASRYVTGAEVNEVKLDTTPQLGGNLDVNGYQITSDNDQDVVINPNGVGIVKIESNLHLRDTAGGTAKQINLYEGFSNGSNYIGIKAPDSLSTDTTYTLPTADGSSGQVLSTNGTGTLSWATAGGGITVGTTAVTSGTDGRVFFQAGGVVQQSDRFTFDNTTATNILQLGAGANLGVSLRTIAPGATSGDIAFRVRNSADTRNFLVVNGAGDVFNNGAQGVTSNTFYGENVGRSASGASNTGIGNSALRNTTTGNLNVAIGENALIANTTGISNVAIGVRTLTAQTSAVYNTAAGYFSLTNSTGSNNSSFGALGLIFNTTGANNVAFGFEAGRRISGGANLTIANQSIFIGVDTRPNADNETNQIVIGHNAIGTGSNSVTLGNTSITRTNLIGQVVVLNTTAPAASITDSFQMYSNDITAGNAAPHFRTENGAIVKVYQETTAVAASTLVSNAGTNITDTDTFDGYTLKQIVKALRNQGLLA